LTPKTPQAALTQTSKVGKDVTKEVVASENKITFIFSFLEDRGPASSDPVRSPLGRGEKYTGIERRSPTTPQPNLLMYTNPSLYQVLAGNIFISLSYCSEVSSFG
jgi:hypothetical protein